ncbi:MAG: hypothetical protein DRJ46_02365, partial [Thermoprotei archaeon]
GWPPDDDPIYKNPPYGDAFVVFMLLTGYGLKPTPQNMPTPPGPAGPDITMIAVILIIALVVIAVGIYYMKKK